MNIGIFQTGFFLKTGEIHQALRHSFKPQVFTAEEKCRNEIGRIPYPVVDFLKLLLGEKKINSEIIDKPKEEKIPEEALPFFAFGTAFGSKVEF